MFFHIEKKLKNSLGRAGVLETPHGVIHTPAFVPVGTKATVKALTPEQVFALGAEVVLANTYHLYLQPGDELVAKAGGLHRFMNWPGPIITDSGGFQVFSLGAAWGKQVSKIANLNSPLEEYSALERREVEEFNVSTPSLRATPQDGNFPPARITPDGVEFRSPIDGSKHFFTPEKSIQIQHNLGADIIFAFDECTSPAENLRYQEEALVRTHQWAERSLEEHWRLKNSYQPHPNPLLKGEGEQAPSPFQEKAGDEVYPALFGIVQGGRDENLRKKSAKFIGGLDFDGFGIGGSFTKEDMASPVHWVNEILPEGKPRHLLGIGEPEDLFMGVENGTDLFDCVAPTRNARNGTLYTARGKINIMNEKYRRDFAPIEEDCGCYTCNLHPTSPLRKGEEKGGGYSRAYLAHLFRSKEMLAATLASIHNLYFIVNLVKKIRQSILDGRFYEFKDKFLDSYTSRKQFL